MPEPHYSFIMNLYVFQGTASEAQLAQAVVKNRITQAEMDNILYIGLGQKFYYGKIDEAHLDNLLEQGYLDEALKQKIMNYYPSPLSNEGKE